jgi:cytochrome d ubiquinol oxidase subunit I
VTLAAQPRAVRLPQADSTDAASAMPDALTLARIQFAANMSFHILFPTISIGLAWMLVWFRWRHARTQDPAWLAAYRLWVKVFALSFALGVVSGVTMSFQFGTNWPGFMVHVGNIAGPLLAYEVLTAFFLEATFLAIMLFGQDRVSARVQSVSALLVAIGTTLSAFWILALNSWMHTPVGYRMIDGRAHATDWLAIVWSPSMPYRFTHMLLACGLTVAFLVAGLSAWRRLRGDASTETALTLATGVRVAAVLIPIQVFVGDQHGLNVLEHQPAKVAAMEAVWDTERGAPLLLFAWPDEHTRSNRYAISIPRGASLILTHRTDGEVRGLNDFAGRHPPVAPVFWGFRIMVGMGLAMWAVSWLAAWRLRGIVKRHRDGATAAASGDDGAAGNAGAPGDDGSSARSQTLVLRLLSLMTFAGWIAVLAGWYVTEIGRQPWLVYGVLRTAEAASTVPSPSIAATLAVYLVLYVLLMVAFVSVLYHLARKASAGHLPVDSRAGESPRPAHA